MPSSLIRALLATLGLALGVLGTGLASAQTDPISSLAAGVFAQAPSYFNALGPASPRPGIPKAQAPGDPRSVARVFYSGHSLLDNPLPEYVASIAQSLNTSVSWNQQNVIGSPIRVRTKGINPNASGFPGYATGKNRSGSSLDVVSELRQPQTIGGQRYDSLVLTERHDLINTLLWENTVEYARHFHDRLIEGNPEATTYLYHSWLGVPDKGAPESWIAYERSVAPAWQCVASRINQSLQHAGRMDRVVYLPAGLALTYLVERAVDTAGMEGVTSSSTRATLDRIFSDDVHLTPLGAYYVALVTYSSLYRRSAVGAWAPKGLTAVQARSLQNLAWEAVSQGFAATAPPDLSACRAVMRDSICAIFYNFTGRPDQARACSLRFSATTADNPFHFDPMEDSNRRLPPP